MLGMALAATALPAQAADANAEINRAWAAGYRAAFTCSSLWNGAGKSLDAIERDELTGIYPEIETDVRALKADVDDKAKRVSVRYRDDMPPRIAEWDSREGCVTRPGRPKLDDKAWPLGDKDASAPMPRAPTRYERAMMDSAEFGGRTSALLIVKNGKIAVEKYQDGHDLHTTQRTFSVAKSMAATLIGNAVAEGDIDVAKPAMIAGWQAPGDPRAAITTEQLMRMASGLTSDTAGNRSDAIYMGGASVRQWTVQWPLLNPPGSKFRYANNDTLLAVQSLKAAQQKALDELNAKSAMLRTGPALDPVDFFDHLGMTRTFVEHDADGDYILSSQVWTSARDLARLGLLYQNDGMWQGRRLLPENWRRFVTTPSGPQPDGPFGYGAGFWLLNKSEGIPADAFGAFGNRGQYVVVIPSRQLVIVRQGYDDDKNRLDIAKLVRAVVEADAAR
jgi:CubicO group peptidase (beta-lactamase class C family)